eukprot:3977804-Alexandrium_andersonii.AAC.1
MSASLVGSEMCIRDRASTPRCTRTRESHPTDRANAPETHLPRGRRTTAVSYTHLTLPTICSV